MAEQYRRKQRLSRDRIIRFILAFGLLWFVASFIISSISNMFVKTMIVGDTVVENLVTPYGMVTYDAYSMPSPLTGQGEAITQEGVRVRKNEAVYRIIASEGSAMQGQAEKILYAPLSGLVSYHIDSYENISTLEEASRLDLEAVYKAQDDKGPDGKATAGADYAKIISSFDDIFIYMDCESNSYTKTFAEGLRIRIRFPEIGYSTICRLVEVKPIVQGDKEHIWVKADLGTADQAVFAQRVWQIELPYDVMRITEIDKQSVIYRDDEAGVYALEKGFAYWQAITIVEEREDTYVVENIANGTEIVTTPKLVSERTRVKGR